MSVPPSSTILANLSPALFQAGPTDVVATPDVYTVNSSQINSNTTINTSVGRFNSFDNSLLGNLRSGSVGILASISSLGSLGSLTNIAASLTTANVAARVGGAMGIPVDASLPASFSMALTQSVNLNSGNYTSLLVSLAGGGTQSILTADVAGTTSMLQAVNNMSGNSKLVTVTDVGASVSAATAITNTLISLGLTAVVASFTSSLTTASPIQNNGKTSYTVGQQALSQNVLQAIQQSDMATVQLCITQLGAGGVLSQVPNAVTLLCQYYRIPAGTVSSGIAALWTTLKGILTTLAPTWNMTSRNGQLIPSLQVFQAASADCLTIMKTDADDTIVDAAWIAKDFPTEDALTTLEQMYPYMLKL